MELKSGKIYVYSEVNFKKTLNSTAEGCRVDGLLILVKSGKIADAVIFEMKSRNNFIEQAQLEKYIELCNELGINKLVTITNQLTSNSSQAPFYFKVNKNSKFNLIHFSWEYVMTIAANFINSKEGIEDNDQKEIMIEVLKYLKCDDTGSYYFSTVSKGWKDFVLKVDNGSTVVESDDCVIETAKDLGQLESHIALELSNLTYSFVGVVEQKSHKENYKEKVDNIIKDLKKDKLFESKLRIKNAISDLEIKLFFATKKVELGFSVEIPEDKDKNKTKLSWLKTFHLDYSAKKNLKNFQVISAELFIDVYIKNTSRVERYPYSEFEHILQKVGDREIKEFKVVIVRNNLGKNFETSKIVSEIESLVRDFYKGIVENFRPSKVEAPKIQQEAESTKNLIVENKNLEQELEDVQSEAVEKIAS